MIPCYEELTADRLVNVDGIYHMRDLGGLPRHDGGSVPRARICRADNLANLSSEGVASLLRLRVRTVIGLRRDEAVRKGPSPLRSRYRDIPGYLHHIVLTGAEVEALRGTLTADD